MDFVQFCQNSAFSSDLAVTDPSNGHFNSLSSTCSLRTQDPRFSVWWQYCLISMIFLLFRQNSTIYTDLAVIQPVQWSMVVLTLCLPPVRWGPRTLDFQCSGSIAWFRWILSNFVKTRPCIQIQPPSDPSNGSFNPLSPTRTLRTQGPRFSV